MGVVALKILFFSPPKATAIVLDILYLYNCGLNLWKKTKQTSMAASASLTVKSVDLYIFYTELCTYGD